MSYDYCRAIVITKLIARDFQGEILKKNNKIKLLLVHILIFIF